MDLSNVRRATSAGYRLPERSVKETGPVTTRGPAETRRYDKESVGPDPDIKDPVKRDRLWREMVLSERRAALEREKNWSFLWKYDDVGQLMPEEPLPANVSLLSDLVPNTSNQMYGSSLGSDVVRLDRLLLWSRRRQKCRFDALPDHSDD